MLGIVVCSSFFLCVIGWGIFFIFFNSYWWDLDKRLKKILGVVTLIDEPNEMPMWWHKLSKPVMTCSGIVLVGIGLIGLLWVATMMK